MMWKKLWGCLESRQRFGTIFPPHSGPPSVPVTSIEKTGCKNTMKAENLGA